MGAATIAQRFVGSYKKEIHPPFRLPRHRVGPMVVSYLTRCWKAA